MKASNNDDMEISAASTKRPVFAPESGEYPTPFDAKVGIRRLLSYPDKTREDVLSVIIAVVESRTASRDEGISDSIHTLVASLGQPQDDVEVRMFAKALRSLGYVNETTAKMMASSDPTGTMAALLLMSPKTLPPTTSSLSIMWSIVSNPSGDALKRRSKVVNKMVELSNEGVADWENEYSSYPVAAVIKNEGWFSPFAKSMLVGFRSLPWPLAEMTMSQAPESIKSLVVKKESMSTRSMPNLVAALTRMTDENEAVQSVSRFMGDKAVPAPEKVKLYEHLVDNGMNGSLGEMPAVRDTGLKMFASLPDQMTFDVALGRFLDGSDTASVAELTGNIEFSILDHKAIINKLERSNLMSSANPRFVEFASAMEANESASSDDLEAVLDENDRLSSAAGLVRIGGMNMGQNTAILCAAILIAIGIPTSLVLMNTGTTGEDLASRPDLARKGSQIARLSETSEEHAKIVERAKALASMPSAAPQAKPQQTWENPVPQPANPVPEKAISSPRPQPQPPRTPSIRPTKEQRMQAQEVNRQLVDAIVMLEHDPNKNFSSKGAGGLMQLMPQTWEEINRKHFNGKYPFRKYATNDWVNRKFGTIYLKQIKDYLDDNRSQWKTDQLPLIFACYFGGIGNVRKANFDPAKLKRHYPKTYDYMLRGSGLMGYDVEKLEKL